MKKEKFFRPKEKKSARTPMADRIMVKRLEVIEMSKIFLLYVSSINMVEGYIWHKKSSARVKINGLKEIEKSHF